MGVDMLYAVEHTEDMSEETMAWIAILLSVLSIGMSVPLIVQTALGFRQLHREERESRNWTPREFTDAELEAHAAELMRAQGLR